MTDTSNKASTAKLKIKVNNQETFEQTLLPRPPVIEEGSIEGITDIGEISFPPVGKCIYCSSVDKLCSEHIVPYGLCGGGEAKTAVLPKASCGTCAKITSMFERLVLRGPLLDVRVLLKLKSRRKHSYAPSTERLTILSNGVHKVIDLPLEEYPILLTFPNLAVPRYLTGRMGTGVDVNGVTTISFGPSPESVLRKYGGQEMELKTDISNPVAFARMIAKIGYALAYAKGALNLLHAPCAVLPSILGHEDDIGQWVGTLTDPIKKYRNCLAG